MPDIERVPPEVEAAFAALPANAKIVLAFLAKQIGKNRSMLLKGRTNRTVKL
jgi:hypothetical protein